MPYLSHEDGYRDLYLVKNIRTGQRNEGDSEDNLRIILELEFAHYLSTESRRLPDISNINALHYTTLATISKAQ